MQNASQNKNPVIAFICEPGELEIKSLLLAYSLRRSLKTDFIPIVLIPLHSKLLIDSISLLLFDKLDVEVRYFDNPLIKSLKKSTPGDAMSNKFYALSSITHKQDILFLDSDIACINSCSQNLFTHSVAAKPADYSLDAQWQEIYKQANLNYPKEFVKCTVDKVESPPYFNTGVIFIKSNSKAKLCEYWKEYFLLFSGKENLKKKLFNPFHRDQLAFALATEKLGLKVKLLDELYNFPARSRGKIPAETIFAHYHDSYTIASEPILLYVFQRFCTDYPVCLKILENKRTWKLISEKRFALLKMDKVRTNIIKKTTRILSRMR